MSSLSFRVIRSNKTVIKTPFGLKKNFATEKNLLIVEEEIDKDILDIL